MGCYQQQGEEGQVVATADSSLIPRHRGAAVGIPVSCGPQQSKSRGGGEGEPASALTLCPVEACSFLILETSSKPTFSHIPEYTGEDHVLKPESGSQKRGEAGKGERREDGAPPGVLP